jgi:hypothetical protein
VGCEAECALALEVALVPAADVLVCGVVAADFVLLVFVLLVFVVLLCVLDEASPEAVLLAGLACANALPAKLQTQASARAQIAPNPAPPVFPRCFSSNGNPSSLYNPTTPDNPGQSDAHKIQKPNGSWHCNHPPSTEAMPVPVGQRQVTEVFQPGRQFRPGGWNHAGGPGIRHPDRSSGSIPPWQNRLRYLPAAC